MLHDAHLRSVLFPSDETTGVSALGESKLLSICLECSMTRMEAYEE